MVHNYENNEILKNRPIGWLSSKKRDERDIDDNVLELSADINYIVSNYFRYVSSSR